MPPRSPGYPAARERPEASSPAAVRLLEAAEQDSHFSGGLSVPGDGAGVSRMEIFNPRESPVELLIESTSVWCDVSLIVSLFVSSTALATLDHRWRNDGGRDVAGIGELRREAGAAILTFARDVARVTTGAPSMRDDLAVILLPGDGLVWEGGTVGVGFSGRFTGRERNRRR